MIEEILPDAEAAALRAAQVVAEASREAVAARGRFLLALSGGSTSRRMLRCLAEQDLPWTKVHIFQTDERVVREDHADRNLAHLRECLLANLRHPPAAVHAMPVEEPNLSDAAARYAGTLRSEAGEPPVIDLVHLGLGEDGHTASLIPGDPALGSETEEVAVTASYKGHRRLTLTFPTVNRARRILWVVTGAEKVLALARLREGDRTIPAGRVSRERALIIADAAAARQRTADE
jgi:6-phosphogluconolactonase